MLLHVFVAPTARVRRAFTGASPFLSPKVHPLVFRSAGGGASRRFQFEK
jgi:hypothetical protein